MSMVEKLMSKFTNREILSSLQEKEYFISEDFEIKLSDPLYSFEQPSEIKRIEFIAAEAIRYGYFDGYIEFE